MACSASAFSLKNKGVSPSSFEGPTVRGQVGEGISLALLAHLPERQKPIAPALARIHIPHDPRLTHRPKCSKCLSQHIVIDLGTEVTDKDVEMMLRILLVLLALIRPVDPHFGIEYLSAIQCLYGLFGRAHIGIFYKSIVVSPMLKITILDDFGRHYGSSDGEDFSEHEIGHSWGEVADVEVGLFRRLGVLTLDETVFLASELGRHGGRGEAGID